jgi:hypothetical protein
MIFSFLIPPNLLQYNLAAAAADDDADDGDGDGDGDAALLAALT